MNGNGISAQGFGVLTAIEMVTAAVCYIAVAHLADKYGRQPFALATFVFFTLFPVSLLFAQSFTAPALAIAIRGLKEFGEPARKALIISYAPPSLQSKAYGVYYLIRDGVVTSGSLWARLFGHTLLKPFSLVRLFVDSWERYGSTFSFFGGIVTMLYRENGLW